ncbi:DUF1178 family protein [Thalassovita taeanensis]|uniref:DUF1178 family protein n=1 Tax=Thalassovita taeanensis TaxID=657014 RepID=A0A1H9A7V6_9RHOB|nr:DUF1178 family protein [Thalassovita taeanensis]SEP72729.1 hypothetical protein SAMN04488092_10238 [Thalassovita taeanensis]
MIQFSLKCSNDHQFDSWFQSGAAFDKLISAGLVTCATCGTDRVEKAIMAPRVNAARDAAAPPPSLRATPTPAEQALTEMKRKIEANSEYVGMNFATEARAMHDGDTPERAIYGEAKPEEARKLIEDGVPVTPLPFLPGRKSN